MNKVFYPTDAEKKLADLIWRTAPITSPDRVAYAKQEIQWKKSTTYTVLKKLCDKGIIRNQNTMITVIIKYKAMLTHQSHRFMEDTYDGSLPKFFASFIGGRHLTYEQANELKLLIDEHGVDYPKGGRAHE